MAYDDACLSYSRLRTMLVIMTTASGLTSERISFQSYRRLHILYGKKAC